MKELREAEGTTATRQQSTTRMIPSDKLLREPDLAQFQHLVTSSVPSPPFTSLTLLNPSALFAADPRAMLSAHLFASIAASNPEARFQIPIPISIAVPSSTAQLFHSAAVGTPVMSTLPPTSHATTAQIDLLSFIQDHHSTQDELKAGNNNNRKKREPDWKMNKTNNKRNATPSPIQNGIISSENHAELKQVMDENDTGIKINSTIIPNDKTSSKGRGKKEKRKNMSMNHRNNNNNNHSHTNNNNNNHDNGLIEDESQGSNQRDKAFSCPICKRTFGYKHVLQNHERTHTGEKPFECTICQKKFTRDHHLKTHVRLHTGEKPYRCDHCDKQFVQVANLRRHLRVHTGERPYICDLCPSRFSDSNQLKAHMLIHNGEKPYTCRDCGSHFRRRHHLAHHKCSAGKNGIIDLKHESPSETFPQILESPKSKIKRGRKPRETRRVIRLRDLPVETVSSSSPLGFVDVIPEQTHPEDLSVGGNGIGVRSYSVSHSSCSGSPSPNSGGSVGSIRLYCHSVTSSEPPGYSSDEERSGTASSSHTGKTESDEASPIQG